MKFGCYAVTQLRSCAVAQTSPTEKCYIHSVIDTATLGAQIVTIEPRPVITHPKVVFLHGRVYTTKQLYLEYTKSGKLRI